MVCQRHHIDGVRGLDAVDQLLDDGQRVFEVERPRPFFRNEVLALDVLHDQVIRSDVVEVADIGVAERGDGAGFGGEALGELSVRNFDRDIAAQARVMSPIDLAHAALAHQRKDLVGAEPVTFRQRHVREQISLSHHAGRYNSLI
jgi:hypothetical protein